MKNYIENIGKLVIGIGTIHALYKDSEFEFPAMIDVACSTEMFLVLYLFFYINAIIENSGITMFVVGFFVCIKMCECWRSRALNSRFKSKGLFNSHENS